MRSLFPNKIVVSSLLPDTTFLLSVNYLYSF